MGLKIYIRKERKSKWERRTPLTPTAVAKLVQQGIPVWVQRSDVRIFPDQAYADAGAQLVDDCNDADIVLGIKEPVLDEIGEQQVHVAFSHTIKGQDYNMGLLRTFLDRHCTLIDYETKKDEQGVRTIAFGRYAGIAGAVDALHVLGRKLALRGVDSPISQIKMTWEYGTIAKLKETFAKLGSFDKFPLRILVVGTGNVGGGAVEVCEWLGLPRVDKACLKDAEAPAGSWYSVVRTADIVRAKDGSDFDFDDYREHGIDKYESCFTDYMGHFNLLLQTPYWEPRFPKMLPRETMLAHPEKLPEVVGDISCDIDGSLECTRKASIIDEPAFSYDPVTHSIQDGIQAEGLHVMSIDHLPCELSEDASEHFSRILVDYMPELVAMDRSKDLDGSGLGRLLKDATIVYNGQLTPNYAYLQEFLDKAE